MTYINKSCDRSLRISVLFKCNELFRWVAGKVCFEHNFKASFGSHTWLERFDDLTLKRKEKFVALKDKLTGVSNITPTMKKPIKILLIVALIALLIGALSACGLWETRISSIMIDNPDNLEMLVGETLQLSVTIKPTGHSEGTQYKAETVDKYNQVLSNGKTVVTVDKNGLITAVDDGRAKVTVQTADGRLKASVYITVTYAPIENLVLSAEGETLQYVGNAAQEIKFALSYGDIEIPETSIITWFIKEKDGDKKAMSEFADSLTASVKPLQEAGYYATVWAVIEYSGFTFTSNEIYFGYFTQYDTNYLTIKDPTTAESGFIRIGENFKVEESIFGENDYYFVEAGNEISLTFLSTTAGSNPYPNCKWYVLISDDNFTSDDLDNGDYKLIEGETGGVLHYTPETPGLRYSIRLYCDGKEAKKEFLFKTTAALVNNLTLKDGDGMTTAKQHISSIKQITLTADWNKANTAGTEYIEWYEGETLLKKGGISESGITTYSFLPPDAACEGTIKVKVYDAEGGDTYKEAEYLYYVVETLLAPKQTKVELISGSQDQTAGVEEVTFKASIVLPSTGVNNTLPVYWYVNGTLVNDTTGYTIDQSAKTLKFTPSGAEEKEYAVYAIIGNVKSNTENVYRFTTNWSSVQAYCTNYFEWEGSSFNKYISSHEEACIAFSYVMVNYDTTGLSLYFDPSLGYDSTTFGDLYANVLCAYYSGGSMPCSYSASGNVIDIRYNSSGAVKEPTTSTTEQATRSDAYDFKEVDLRYASGAVRSTLPIDDNEISYRVTTTEALWRAVSFGYKPTMDTGTTVEEIYKRARAVVGEICTDTMSDVEKIMAICDWLAVNVVYDYTAASMTVETSVALTYDCYYLEGVFRQKEVAGQLFWDGCAVCDGISKAFVLLCGLEDIKAVRVVGTGSGGSHAWNKALVDVNEDGEAEWYSFDLTWASAKSNDSSVEYYYHNYLFQTDDDMESSGHVERNINYAYTASGASKTAKLTVYPQSKTYLNIFSLYDFEIAKSYLKGSYDTSLVDGDVIKGDGIIDSATELAIALVYSYLQSKERGTDVYVILKVGTYAFINGSSINETLIRAAINLINLSDVTIKSSSSDIVNMFNSGSGGSWLVRLVYE